MKKSTLATPIQAAKMPKAEVIEKLAKNIAATRILLETAKAQLQTAVSPAKYALNFQVNALKKQVNFGKAQISRLKKEPRTEVFWETSFGA